MPGPTWAEGDAPTSDETIEDRLDDVLEVLKARGTGSKSMLRLVKKNEAIKKHLLQLYDIIKSYREKGHFLKVDERDSDESNRKERVCNKEAAHAMQLFGMFLSETEKTAAESMGFKFKKSKGNKKAYTLELVGLGLNIAAFILSTIAASHVDVGLPVEGMNSTNPISWGYVNALGGVVQGIAEIKLGNTSEGAALLLSSSELITATVLTHLGHAAGLITAMSAGGIMAGSYALCMITAWGIERNQARIANQRIKLLETDLATLRTSSVEDRDAKIERLEYAIMFEKGKRQNHLRQASSWKWSALVMLTASVVVVLALGTLSLGAVPAISAAITALAILTNMIRRYVANRVDYTARAQLSRNENLLETLSELSDTTVTMKKNNAKVDLNVSVSFGIWPCTKTMTLGNYFKTLLHRDPERAKSLMTAFGSGDGDQFLEALEVKDSWSDGNRFSKALIDKYGEKPEAQQVLEDNPLWSTGATVHHQGVWP